MRQGTLEFLLATPITPKRLILGMSIAPLMITMVLCFASIPSMLCCLSRLDAWGSWMPSFITLLLMPPVIWFLLILSVWGGSKVDQYQSGVSGALGYALVCFMCIFLFVIIMWGGLKMWYILIHSGLLFLPFMLWDRKKWKKKWLTPFAIEDLEKQRDPNAKTISGLFAFLRRHEGTIFSHEEGVSKYMTLEQVRQQTIGGPFIHRQNVRDIMIVALFLLSPLVLLAFMKYEPGIYSVLGVPFVIILTCCSIYSATNAMREMLNERSSLRLDSMRITLIPLTEITDTKETVAALLPMIIMKWLMIFFILWMVVVDFFQPMSVFVVTGCFIVQAWLALNLAARLGLLLGFSSSDELEGQLWVFSSLFAWLGAPYILWLMVGDSSNVLIPYIASISPVHSLLSISFQPLDISTIMPFVVGLALQYAIFVLIAHFNQNKMRYAWR